MTILKTAITEAESVVGVAGTVASGLGWFPWVLAGAMLVAGAGGTMYYRMEWLDCKASIAIDANLAQEKLRVQREADTKFRNNLSEQLAPILTDIRNQNQNVQTALAKVKSIPACSNTDAARAYDSIVQPRPVQTNPGPKRPAGPGSN